MKKQIIAIGGGGFLGGTDNNFLFDQYILGATEKKNPKICFLGTASGDSIHQIKHFLYHYSYMECQPSYLSLFSPNVENIEEFIMEQDAIYVGGGNSLNLLAIWEKRGLDKILLNAYNNGTVLSGVSAGSVCWFKECVTDSFPGALQVMPALGFLPYSNSPHFTNGQRRRSYRKFLKEDKIIPGYAAEDGAALHFVDNELQCCISEDPDASCYSMAKDDEQILDTYYIGELLEEK